MGAGKKKKKKKIRGKVMSGENVVRILGVNTRAKGGGAAVVALWVLDSLDVACFRQDGRVDIDMDADIGILDG